MAPPSVPGVGPSFMLGETVRVRVGKSDNLKTFTIHKDLLSFYSGYFEAAINGRPSDSETRIIRLLEEEEDTFKAFSLWLYTGALDVPNHSPSDIKYICKLYDLADRRKIPLLKNIMVDRMRDVFLKPLIHPGNVQLLYKNTTPSSALRRLSVFLFTKIANPDIVMQDYQRESWSRDAIWDVAKALWTDTQTFTREQLTSMSLCQFHDHEESVKCDQSTRSKRKANDEGSDRPAKKPLLLGSARNAAAPTPAPFIKAEGSPTDMRPPANSPFTTLIGAGTAPPPFSPAPQTNNLSGCFGLQNSPFAASAGATGTQSRMPARATSRSSGVFDVDALNARLNAEGGGLLSSPRAGKASTGAFPDTFRKHP